MEYLLKMLFFANIASNLKVESMHLAHRNCEYILGVIYLFVFPVLLWADNKVNTYHFKSISTSVNFPTNEVRKLFQDSQGFIYNNRITIVTQETIVGRNPYIPLAILK